MVQIVGKAINKLKKNVLKILNYFGEDCKSQSTTKSSTDEMNYIFNEFLCTNPPKNIIIQGFLFFSSNYYGKIFF